MKNVAISAVVDYITMFIEKLWKEKVLIIAMLLAICSSFITTPKLSYIDFKVLVLIFNLMIIVAAFKKLKVMDIIAMEILSKCSSTRVVSMVFIAITFFLSMLVTNDVALITFVPLTILTFNKTKVDPMKTIILQTLAANIGSSLTPMGNPQNLFLFTHYNLNAMEFFKVIIPFVLFGFIWLLWLNRRVPKRGIRIKVKEVHINDKKRVTAYIILFIFVIASVFGIINYKYTLIAVILGIIIMDRRLFKEVDYFLLATFICFFVFIGNISNIEIVKIYLKGFLKLQHMTYFSSIILSQVVSNMPCAILVSSFTNNWKEILLGVDIGGMGTIIASLASLISYKIYVKENEDKGKVYLKKFNLYNFSSLLLFTLVMFLWIRVL
ncbi:SLC13 family permease [Clostridium akagii]|uniref:SLC13 family permease n=1 Tax=Clostridium akagii TaxID=91623 RepID=UPI000478983E|nr:SLC13 family permease [Clostridium akagii]